MARASFLFMWLPPFREAASGHCGEGRAPVGNVIILNAEDGAEDTIVPRLIAAGADRERIHIVSAVLQKDGKGRRTFNLQADLALLERKIREIGNVALVIIDPISSYMGKTDSHKNSEVRGALEPVSEMAARMKVAILSITHFSKAGSANTTKALHRFIGSIAFVGAPRAAFAVIEDAENEGRILVLHAKNNMAPKPQGLAYRLLQTIVCDNIVASYVHWDAAPVTISADEALGATEERGRSSRETAETFLRERLAGGPVPQREVKADAEGAGLAWATVRRAKDRLGIKPEKSGMEGGWIWRLPATVEGAQISRRCSTREVSTFGGNEHLREPNGYGVPVVEETPDAPDLSSDLDIPDNLRRCAYCGQPGTPADPLHHGRWRPRKPEGDWVHAGCKHPWQAGGWRRRRNP